MKREEDQENSIDNKDKKSSEQLITNVIRWLAIIFVIVSILLLVAAISIVLFDREIFNWFTKLDLPKAALLGSYFGGFIGVFWAAAGSLLIFLNLYEQKQQFNKNQFDSSFFNLMNFYYKTLEEITGNKVYFSPGEGEYRGRRYLRYAHDDLKIGLQRLLKQIGISKQHRELYNFIVSNGAQNLAFKEELKKFVNEEYSIFYDTRKAQLGHYFRLIFNIIKYIDESKMSFNDKCKYVNIIQALMSDVELGLICFNALSEKGEKLHIYMERYSFLENISEDGIIFPVLKMQYPNTKFKF